MIKGSEAIRRLTENESTSITIDNRSILYFNRPGKKEKHSVIHCTYDLVALRNCEGRFFRYFLAFYRPIEKITHNENNSRPLIKRLLL